MTDHPQKTVSLVLGSGGARGIAHIGVIHWLEENGFIIKSISGCSMGALVGGIYGAGKLEKFEKWILALERREMLSLMDPSWSSGGLIKGEKLIKHLINFIGDRKIEELPIKFTAVAADIYEEKEVWINTGSLFTAIRASISLPLIFTPVMYHGSLVIDGGVLNPVPIAPTFSDRTDLTIAVNLGGSISYDDPAPIKPEPKPKPEPEPKPELQSTEDKKEEESPGFLEEYLQKLKRKPEAKDTHKRELKLLDVAHQSFDSMQSTIARQKLAAYPPDETIEIPRNSCGMLDFSRSSEMIRIGHEAAQKSLGHLIRKQTIL